MQNPGLAPGVLSIEHMFWPLKIGAKPARLLHFPKDYSLGEIRIAPNPYDFRTNEKGLLAGAARGDVSVAANKIVVFTPAQHFYKNPAIVKTFPVDAFDGLRIASSSLDDSEDDLCHKAMAQVGYLTGVTWLNMDRSDSNDADLAHAAEFPELQSLSAFSTTVTGSFLKATTRLKKLRSLHLSYNNLKEDNLVYLEQLPRLNYLYLGRSGISDKGMQYIACCPSIQVLDISQNNINDASIKPIQALKNLQILSCKGTHITPAGLMKLKGLPLTTIILPAVRYRSADITALRKAFPGVNLVAQRGSENDREVKELYAPLH